MVCATVRKEELPDSILKSTSTTKMVAPIYQSTWSHIPEELNLNKHCCKIFRCHEEQKILLIKDYSTPTSVHTNRQVYVILYQYRRLLYPYRVLLKLQICFNFQRHDFCTHYTFCFKYKLYFNKMC